MITATFYAKSIDDAKMLLRELTEEEKGQYSEKDKNGFYLWDNLRRRGGNSRPKDRPNQWFPLYVHPTTLEVNTEELPGTEEYWPIDPQGERRIWRVNPDGARRGIAKGDIAAIKKAGRIEIVKKSRMPSGKKPKTLWYDSIYSATTYGTKLLINIIKNASFTYPKSLYLVRDCLRHWADEDALVLDFFGGSGTTGHAVLDLNNEDEGTRRYILVEVGEHFDSVMKPRLQKVMFSAEWKDGKPGGKERISHIFKYQNLESYEDTLNNIELNKSAQSTMFEDYTLRYMLDYEARGSESLLKIDKMAKPFDYELDVYEKGERKRKKIDLIETFNYLLGLEVNRIRTYRPEDEEQQVYRVVFGNIDGKAIAVVWRNTDGLDLEADKQFIEKEIIGDETVDLLYINGDSIVPNAHPIEKTFKERMFAPLNV